MFLVLFPASLRRFLLPSLLVCLILPLGSEPLRAEEAGGTAVVVAHMFPQRSLPDVAATMLANDLRALKGVSRVTVAGAAKLGDERENLRQLQRGDIDIAIVGDLVLSYLIPRYRVVTLPFSHRTPEEALAVYGSDLGLEIQAEFRKRGLEVLSWHCIGTRLLTANRPIRSRADLAGLKLRLPPNSAWVATWKALGAAPRAVPFTELYDTLKRGGVEAQENPPNFIRSKRFYEVQSHLMLSRHLVQQQFILASPHFMKTLAPGQGAVVRDAAQKASHTVCNEALSAEGENIAWLENQGMKVVELDLFEDAAAVLPQVAESLDGKAGLDLLSRVIELRSHAK